jgi:tRNA-specific adenosine deaminase 3
METDAPLTASSSLEIRSTPYTGESNARGVFATKIIRRGTLIERAHTIRFTAEEHDAYAMKTVLQHYTFCAGGGEYYLALGIGSLFNHRDPPNVEFRVHRGTQTISYLACSDIDVDEELCIFYGRNLWFDDHLAATQEAPVASATTGDAEGGDNLPFSDLSFD